MIKENNDLVASEKNDNYARPGNMHLSQYTWHYLFISGQGWIQDFCGWALSCMSRDHFYRKADLLHWFYEIAKEKWQFLDRKYKL